MPIEKYLKKLIYLGMEINKQRSTVRSSASEAIIDQGLRSYMLKVYNYMSSALALTGIIALLTAKFAVVSFEPLILSSLGNSLYNSGLAWVVMLAPLGVVFYMSFGIAKMSAAKAQTVFWIFASLMGLSLSSIFMRTCQYHRVFFITAGTFGAMSIYGYSTKRSY